MSRPDPRHLRTGFSLIELLVVIAILAILGGMMAYNFSRPEVRRESVRLAAEELAATLRQARVLAMERKSAHAVVFHVQNAPGSSGAVLNNRSGGHWYRILGPNTLKTSSRIQQYGSLPPTGPEANRPPFNVTQVEELVHEAWVDDAHVLSPGKVRFLALTDLDYGGMYRVTNAYRGHHAALKHTSYPRPWFGWYDASSKRLYPWGGYDPAIIGSGFFYWGRDYGTQATRDPEPVGSVHPVGRVTGNWASGGGKLPTDAVLYEAGAPRPLINALWQDARIVFLSSGEVQWGNWLPARREEGLRDSAGVRRGVFDRTNGNWRGNHNNFKEDIQTEAGNFDQATGGWFITLAPDVRDDNDRFETAEEAIASMAPMYRVFVSRMGEIRVIPVRRTRDFGSATLLPSDANWWQSNSNLENFFPKNRYIEGGTPVGQAITDVVTPQMLRERQVWQK